LFFASFQRASEEVNEDKTPVFPLTVTRDPRPLSQVPLIEVLGCGCVDPPVNVMETTFECAPSVPFELTAATLN